MKLKFFKYFTILTVVVTFASCNWLNTDVTLSSNASFISLTFASNDSIPGLGSAAFTLQWDSINNDSVIVNLDSLPYNTDITHVIPSFTFESTSGAYVLALDSLGQLTDTIIIVGSSKDTLNFDSVKSVTNIAEDGVTKKVYPIKVNVHKVEPDLYVWNKKVDQIYSHAGSIQKALYFNNTFFLYVSTSVKNYLYTSSDGVSWNSQSGSLTLPLGSNIRNMMMFDGKLYDLNENGKLYSSADGINWTDQNGDVSAMNYNFTALLFSMSNKLWGIFQSTIDQSYHFADTEDGKTWYVNNQIPDRFPIGDFSALSFNSRTHQPMGLVAGGYTADGTLLDDLWTTEDGSYWIDYSTENKMLGSFAGAAIINYDDKLLLFGGLDSVGDVSSKPYMVSIDQGLSWSVPDTTYNRLRQVNISADNDTTYINYQPRTYQSAFNVVVNHPDKGTSDHYIYLIGGINPRESKVYSDVWVGKLNRLSFLR